MTCIIRIVISNKASSTAAVATTWLLRQPVLPRLQPPDLRSLSLLSCDLPLLGHAVLGLALARLPPLRVRGLVLDVLARLCCSPSPSAASAVRSLASRSSVASGLVPQPPGHRGHRSFFADRPTGGPVDCEGCELVYSEADGLFRDPREDTADLADWPPGGGRRTTTPWSPCAARGTTRRGPRRRPVCCRDSALASGAASCGQLAAALDGVREALAPAAASPADLGDCLPLVCALASAGLLRCLGARPRPRACVVCVAGASGDAAGVLGALARQPFALGRPDAVGDRLEYWARRQFVPRESLLSRSALTDCRPRDHGLQPLY
eukprot:m51a1_g9820 hypothetical protein (322) ;mRNA; f:1894201-1895384